MNLTRASRSCIDVVICGVSPATQEVWKAAASLESYIKISGYWSADYSGKSCPIPNVPTLAVTFDGLLKNTQYDLIILCLSPQAQYKLLKNSVFKLENMAPSSGKSSFPAVILIPPVSPCYDFITLSDARNFVGVAMPFRRLASVATLCAHLRSKLEVNSLMSAKYPSRLPSKWILGAVRSFHVRLRADNPVKVDQYSWLCEPGAIGGGLLNIYGGSLIDLAFFLTAGLRITSVSCLCRTFDTEVSSRSGSIRRISADDYVLATAEMEPKCGTSRGPVAVFYLAADLPRTSSESTKAHSVYYQQDDEFTLEIELVGSSGRFLISSCHEGVRWSPVGRIVDRSVFPNDGRSTHCSTVTNERGYSFQTDSISLRSAANGISQECERPFDDCVSKGTTNDFVPNGPNSPVTLRRGEFEPRESSTIPNSDENFHKTPPTETSYHVREMWKQWLMELSSAIRGPTTRQSLESFVATPEHWGYIQRVLIALDKAARMRCWVDVATGERV